jgi:putative ABC transport system permease protein
MTLWLLAAKNLKRSPQRSVLTVLAVAVCVVAFLLIRSVSAGWTETVSQTPTNRVVSRHKIGWDQAMPVHYVAEVAAMDGIRHAMGGSWAGLKHPSHAQLYIDATAVQALPFVTMHYELVAPPEQKQAFVAERRGLMVSDELAERFGWHLGDTVHLTGTFTPGDFVFIVTTIYHSTRHGFGQHSVWLHWEYLNDRLPLEQRDRINIISSEIVDPSRGAELAKAIDVHFDTQDNQTFTQEDQALNASFVGAFAAILEALDIASVLILGVLLLTISNTIAMSTRESIPQLGLLKALGFPPRLLLAMISGEAAFLGLLGGFVGVVLSLPVVEGAASRFLVETMDMAPLLVPRGPALLALLFSPVLGALAALVPGRSATSIEVTQALRHRG